MTRFELWEAIRTAVEASFPDRAPELLAGLERRLEPGPWSVAVAPVESGHSRDRIVADISRGLHANAIDAAEAEGRVRELEQWLRDSCVADLQAQLAMADRGVAWNEHFIEWAGRALEAGFDSPSLRMLAGIEKRIQDEAGDLVSRAMRELDLQPAPPAASLELAKRWVCREFVQGRLDETTLLRRAYDLSPREMTGETDVWRDIYWEWDLQWERMLEEGSAKFHRVVRDAARAELGAPPESDDP